MADPGGGVEGEHKYFKKAPIFDKKYKKIYGGQASETPAPPFFQILDPPLQPFKNFTRAPNEVYQIWNEISKIPSSDYVRNDPSRRCLNESKRIFNLIFNVQ